MFNMSQFSPADGRGGTEMHRGMEKYSSSPLKMKTIDAYLEQEYNIIQLQNTSVYVFFPLPSLIKLFHSR